MDNLRGKIEELQARAGKLAPVLSLTDKVKRLEELRQEMAAPDFWQDQKRAAALGQEAERLAGETGAWEKFSREFAELSQLLSLAEAEDQSLLPEIGLRIEQLEKYLSQLELKALLSEKYDGHDAILAIHAGTGGIDAQDWAQMLERMYLRLTERKGWKVEILDRNLGQEAGLKSSVLRLVGPYAYGYLKSENGVHRLLRNSPFNADGLRQTSFALVEVTPELEDEGEIEIKDEDLRIDVFRSSGPGGQSVNTTDSAVRIVHLPSGITISCQSERSQKQNKENALKILRSKLYQAALESREAEEKKLRGGVQKAEWGKQIRSYFLYGNRLVKDHRSQQETSDVDSVLDGDLEPFIEAYLRWRRQA